MLHDRLIPELACSRCVGAAAESMDTGTCYTTTSILINSNSVGFTTTFITQYSKAIWMADVDGDVQCVELNKVHSGDQFPEKRRVVSNGGRVTAGVVNGRGKMTRALGVLSPGLVYQPDVRTVKLDPDRVRGCLYCVRYPGRKGWRVARVMLESIGSRLMTASGLLTNTGMTILLA